jgi:hypothetical protein
MTPGRNPLAYSGAYSSKPVRDSGGRYQSMSNRETPPMIEKGAQLDSQTIASLENEVYQSGQ